MKINLIIPWHINGSSVIQSSMQHGNSIIFRHIDLIQDTKASMLGTSVNTTLPKFYLIVLKSIRTDQISAVSIHMKGYIVDGSAENISKILCQYIFASGLRSCEKKIFPLKKGSHGHFKGFFSIEMDRRLLHTPNSICSNRVFFSEFQNLFDQVFGNSLFS